MDSSSTVTNDRSYADLQGVTIVPRGFLIPKHVVDNRWFTTYAIKQLTYVRFQKAAAA